MKDEERIEKGEERQRSMFIPHPASRFSFYCRSLNSQFAIRNSRSATAFTLVEIMVVLFIIMVLSGLIVGAAKYAQTKAARSRAEAEVAAMETALENFKVDNGYYPRSGNPRPITTSINTNSYVVFTALAAGPKKYMTFKPSQFHIVGVYTNILDPFGNDYGYYCYPGTLDQTNSVTFDLWSYGPDGQNDTADDIINWRH
jgi:general secretion pathway protein G